MEHHPSGRHRRPRQSLAGRVWALTAALLAIALASVFVPQHPQRPYRERAAITPPPRRRELPSAPARRPARDQGPPDFPGEDVWRTSASRTSSRWYSHYRDAGHVPGGHATADHAAPARATGRRGTAPDEVAGALVRPYMPPFPRMPVGDLLAEPSAAPLRPAAPARPGTPAPAPARDVPDVPDDLGDLADAVRRYLDRVG